LNATASVLATPSVWPSVEADLRPTSIVPPDAPALLSTTTTQPWALSISALMTRVMLSLPAPAPKPTVTEIGPAGTDARRFLMVMFSSLSH
jgi:hypothetical protein